MKEFAPFAFGGLIIGVLVWWFFIRKKDPPPQPLVKNVYVNGPAVPAGFDADAMAKMLHDSMAGGFFKKLHWYSFFPPALIAAQLSSTEKEDNAWQWLYNQNEQTIKVVYYTFNSHYEYEKGMDRKRTLTWWIENTDAQLSGRSLQKKLLAKLRALKLY